MLNWFHAKGQISYGVVEGAWEINTKGAIATGDVNTIGIPTTFLLGLRKIADCEKEVQPAWNSALARLWNNGMGNDYGYQALNVGLYLLHASQTPYVPLSIRADKEGPSVPTNLLTSAIAKEEAGAGVPAGSMQPLKPTIVFAPRD